MKKKQHIHFVGIKGVGMTPLALIAKEAGLTVSGCDTQETFITDSILESAKIKPLIGFSPEHLKDVSLVITTGAHGGLQNPEVIAAKAKGIPILTQGEAVGRFMEGSIFGKKFVGISITGTHGKTTTTAMVATILRNLKQDPSFIIGTSHVPTLGAGGHFGKGKYFVAEADEYATDPVSNKKAKFLWQLPKVAVITNIEHDHPDIYPTFDSLKQAFLQFIKQIPPDGLLVACGDDPVVLQLLSHFAGRKKTYGFSPNNDYHISRISLSESRTFFHVSFQGTDLGQFSLQLPGEHNALNALSASIAVSELGFSFSDIQKALTVFRGSKRRLEFVGTLPDGALVYDDYAHHPTEIQKTLATLHQMFPKKHVVAVFQPHTFSRTKTLFNEFVRAFDDASEVILTDIYASKREADDPSVSSAKLAFSIQTRNKNVSHKPTLSDVVEYLKTKRFGYDTVVIILGAGDIYDILSLLPLTVPHD